jgi:Serine aminopeptidase, S33
MEKTVVFGKHTNLVGTYCQTDAVPSQMAVLFLTPGMLHHVGPMRLHVQLARRLAKNGISSLRYDLSGIGESLAVGSAGSSLQRATQEAIEAMDWVQSEQGIRHFALFGLCSGADDALAIAQRDARVVGVSMMDGLAYRTKAFYLHRFLKKHLPKSVRASKWFTLWESIIGRKDNGSRSMPLGDDIREFPNQSDAERQIRNLLARDVLFQLIYTGGAIDYYSYQGQFSDMFPAFHQHPNIVTRYYPKMDHVATLAADREELLAEVEHWLIGLSYRVTEHQPAQPVYCDQYQFGENLELQLD